MEITGEHYWGRGFIRQQLGLKGLKTIAQVRLFMVELCRFVQAVRPYDLKAHIDEQSEEIWEKNKKKGELVRANDF